MTNYTGAQGRKSQEIIVKPPEKNRVAKLKQFFLLNNMWQYLVTAIAQRQEPKVWQSTDRFGQTRWHAYDPVTGRSVCRDCEAEIRIWLEERYYR
jgi:hypothetical protein